MRAEKEIQKLFTMQDALCVSVYVEHILTFFDNWLVISFIWFELYCNNINVRLILSAYYAFVLLTEFQVTYLGGNFYFISLITLDRNQIQWNFTLTQFLFLLFPALYLVLCPSNHFSFLLPSPFSLFAFESSWIFIFSAPHCHSA